MSAGISDQVIVLCAKQFSINENFVYLSSIPENYSPLTHKTNSTSANVLGIAFSINASVLFKFSWN